MSGRRLTACLAVFAAALAAGPVGARAASIESGDVYARYDGSTVTLGNGVAERDWSRGALRTSLLFDKRDGGHAWSRGTPDFVLELAGATIPSDSFAVTAVDLAKLERGGVRVTMHLTGSGAATGVTAVHVAEAYPGVAGFRTQTTLTSTVALPLGSATVEEAGVGRAKPVLRGFRAGTDWRDPDWKGPPLWAGYAQPGDVRQDTTAGDGGAVETNAEWVEAHAGGRGLFMALERNDLPSSRAGYDGTTASVRVDYTKDVIDLGPFEEMIHVENPASGGGRTRTLEPGQPLALEAAFTGFATHDGDEESQWQRYLADHRVPPYDHAVAWNSDKVDSNARSTGSKDDTDIDVVRQTAPIAKRLGVETFVLDDGWASRDGDWEPDSPQYPEPRWDGLPNSKFRPRFPDATFAAVRAAIAPMKLGLWMSPLNFNPQAQTFKQHPDWACHPISDPLVAYNLAQPDDGSNEAGIGEWSSAAFPHVESRIRDAIDHWGARYFKFDFMVWLDCAGQGDLYQDHDRFVAMIDRLRRDRPDVTFQIDETNDYRMFPFESAARGPTWFQNGYPDTAHLLHNLWLLGPYVPAYGLGQHLLGGDSWKGADVNTLMAAALPSAITFWTDLRRLPDPVVATAARWIAFYKAHRSAFTLATYALLDDPLKKGWTALQEWDPNAARGSLLAFRQDAGDATRRIALRNVPPGLRFHLIEGPDGKSAGTVSSAELTHGIDVTIPSKGGARVLVIEPVERPGPAVSVTHGTVRRCVDRRKRRFRLHHSRGARVVEVYAYVNGRRRAHRRGHDLRQVRLRRLPKGRFTVRIETFQSNGHETVSVRRYHGCKKGRPHTHRRHPHKHKHGG